MKGAEKTLACDAINAEGVAAAGARRLLLETFGEAHSELVERVLFQLDAQEAVDALFASAGAFAHEPREQTSDPFDDPFATFATQFDTPFGEEPLIL